VGGSIVHWDGSAWSTVASPTTGVLIGVWGSGPSDVWAVGYDISINGTIEHWDGSAWSTVPNPTSSVLHAVWGSGPRDVWAVGLNGTIVHYH
jgi:hypothetical protein